MTDQLDQESITSPEAPQVLPREMQELLDVVKDREGDPAGVEDFRALKGLFDEAIDGTSGDRYYIKGTKRTRSSGDLRQPDDTSGLRMSMIIDPQGELISNQYKGNPSLHFRIEKPNAKGKVRDLSGDTAKDAWGMTVRISSVGDEGRVIATVSGKSSVEGGRVFLPDAAGSIHTASKELIAAITERVGEPGNLEPAAPKGLRKLLGRFAGTRK